MYKTSALTAAVLAAALLAPAAAHAQGAAIMSLNSIGTGDLPHADCMRKAKNVIRDAGFEYFDTTSEAVWGRTDSHRDMVSIYCLKSHDVAIFAAASPTGRGSVTGPLVDRLVKSWQDRDDDGDRDRDRDRNRNRDR
ncbi:MAG TPA: hypothetical protein VG475_07475 [Pseudolabrys sp.]|nr:hypothetical protein [Pseudolabrys sp.]